MTAADPTAVVPPTTSRTTSTGAPPGVSRPSPTATVAPSEMSPGLPADEVRRRLASAARSEESSRRVLAFYLVEMESRRLYQATGHGSTAYYAETRLGLDRRRVAELLRVGGKLLELRATDRAFCAGRLGWAKLLILARMATSEHEAAWLERALVLDARELGLLAARSVEGCAPRAAHDNKGLPEIRFPVSASVSPLVWAKLEQVQRRLAAEFGREVDVAQLLATLLDEFLATEAEGDVAGGSEAGGSEAGGSEAGGSEAGGSEAGGSEAGGDQTESRAPGRRRIDASIYRVQLVESGDRGGPLLVETEDGLLPIDGGGPGKPGATSESVRCDAGVRNHLVPGSHDHDHRARDVKTPPRMRRSVLRRDGYRCRSCRSRRSLMAHHVEFRSHGGRTLVDNLVTLCTRCHGLVHADLLVIEGERADAVRFLDAAGHPLESPGEVAALEVATIAPPPPAAETAPGLVTLTSIPQEVDATWWRLHAHLVQDRGENGNLRFQAGTALEEAQAPDPAPAAPESAAFAGLVGQDERIARLRRVARAAQTRNTPFPHVLLTGPAGTGKTTLAHGIAAAIGKPLAEVSAPLLTDKATWIRLLAGLAEGTVLFLDEAHALPRPLLDALLEALAERKLSLVLSDGVRARRVTLRLPSFTLVAATTDEGAIPPALRTRFGLRETLVHYGEEALAEVVRAAAATQGAEASTDGARRLARAARGTPREALRLLERALDEQVLGSAARIDGEVVGRTLEGLGYDQDDLDPGEQRYLEVLRASSTPVPLSRLARALGTTPRTLVEHVEPWLFSRGFVRMTLGGRVATPRLHRATTERGAPNVRHRVPSALAAP